MKYGERVPETAEALPPEFFDDLYSASILIAARGKDLTAAEDEEWNYGVHFPNDVEHDRRVARCHNLQLSYGGETLEVGVKVYGESLGALSQPIVPVANIFVDLYYHESGDPIMGCSYELSSDRTLVRDFRILPDLNATDACAQLSRRLLEDQAVDIGIVPSQLGTWERVSLYEAERLAQLLQIAYDEGTERAE